MKRNHFHSFVIYFGEEMATKQKTRPFINTVFIQQLFKENVDRCFNLLFTTVPTQKYNTLGTLASINNTTCI